jgi:hypothetical protein
MDGMELELVCPCGFENFERIVVQRKPHPPVVLTLWRAWAAERCIGRPRPRRCRRTSGRATE